MECISDAHSVKNMISVKYCCFDSSAFSFGFACAHGNTLILEKSENALSDYVNGVIPCRILCAPQTIEGKKFFAFLKNSGCVNSKGVLDSPSLAPAAAEYALNFDVLLNTRVVSCEKTNDGYTVLIHSNSGLQNVICEKIVSRPVADGCVKYFNCIVSGTEREALSKIEEYGATVHESFENDEFIISMPFNPECRLNEARITFVDRMKKCFGTSVKIDAFAADFSFGSAYRDIVEEFEAGVNFDIQ